MLAQRLAGGDLVTCDPNVQCPGSLRLCASGRLKTAPGPASTSLGEACPKRVGELGDKRAMALEFLEQRVVRPRRARLADPHRAGCGANTNPVGVGDQPEPDLPAAGELDIDLRQ